MRIKNFSEFQVGDNVSFKFKDNQTVYGGSTHGVTGKRYIFKGDSYDSQYGRKYECEISYDGVLSTAPFYFCDMGVYDWVEVTRCKKKSIEDNRTDEEKAVANSILD